MSDARRISPLATWEANRAFHRARRTRERHVKLVALLRRASARIQHRRAA